MKSRDILLREHDIWQAMFRDQLAIPSSKTHLLNAFEMRPHLCGLKNTGVIDGLQGKSLMVEGTIMSVSLRINLKLGGSGEKNCLGVKLGECLSNV